jgi:hypothetical protein
LVSACLRWLYLSNKLGTFRFFIIIYFPSQTICSWNSNIIICEKMVYYRAQPSVGIMVTVDNHSTSYLTYYCELKEMLRHVYDQVCGLQLLNLLIKIAKQTKSLPVCNWFTKTLKDVTLSVLNEFRKIFFIINASISM